jgi:A/G-specific adenine glycosylase
MTKRKKSVDYSSSQEEDSASDFELISIKRSVASRRKRRSTTARKVSTDERTETSASDTYYVTPHPRSQHLISSPDLMRSSLLEWYSGVHEVRGMPWRKAFDPSLDADARAQRAYEVSRRQHDNQELGYSIQCFVLKVWISEIMLQQTQVATVIPYYNKWMSK